MASAWSDGTVRLLDPESNKVAHQILVSEGDGEAPEITCLAWATNSTVLADAKCADAGKTVWQQMLAEEKLELAKLLKKDEATLDLPRDIALLDVEPSLPKISTLPSGGTVDDIFSTRASLDSLFRPFDPRVDEAVDVMVVGTSDGNIHLSIYDSFVVGSFPSPIRASRAASNVLVSHSSHKAYSVHGLLLKSTSTLVQGLSFVPMDLRFITSSKDRLSLLASRSTALQNLLRYVNQVKDLMGTEYNTSRDLPSKFLRNVNDAFTESGKGWSIVPALYHQVVTGHTLPEVKEWLEDVGERGYKRWDKAVSTSLNNLRSHIHKKLIPTLTRIALILSRLHGLALYHSPNAQSPSTLGFSAPQIALLLDTVASITLVAEHMLTAVVDEIDIFATFTEWFKNEMHRVIIDKAPTEEQLEKESNINHSKVLMYIQNSLVDSKLNPFFGEVTEEEVKKQYENIGTANPIFEPLSQALRRCEEGDSYATALPNVKVLVKHLEEQACAVFKQIAEAEKRNVIFGSAVDIPEGLKDGPVVMRMLAGALPKQSITYIAQIGKDGESVQIHQVVIDTQNGVSSHQGSISTYISVGEKVIDVAFHDDDWLLILCLKKDGKGALVRVNYGSKVGVLGWKGPKQPDHIADVGAIVKTDFAADPAGFVPEKMAVSEIGRVVLLAKGGMRYKVYMVQEEGARDTDSMLS